MHGAGNLLFAAEVPKDKNERKLLEETMIYNLQPRYCNQGKGFRPPDSVKYKYVNEDDIPQGLLQPSLSSHQTGV